MDTTQSYNEESIHRQLDKSETYEEILEPWFIKFLEDVKEHQRKTDEFLLNNPPQPCKYTREEYEKAWEEIALDIT